MKRTTLTAWYLLLAATVCGALKEAQAASSVMVTPAAEGQVSKYRRPEDLLDMIPFIADLPRSFIFGDGFKMKLSGQELRIDHMGTKSRNPAGQRHCMIGLSYTTPVAFFTTRVDVPLFHASTLTSHWAPSSMGDYVAFFSRTPTENASAKLVITARF